MKNTDKTQTPAKAKPAGRPWNTEMPAPGPGELSIEEFEEALGRKIGNPQDDPAIQKVVELIMEGREISAEARALKEAKAAQSDALPAPSPHQPEIPDPEEEPSYSPVHLPPSVSVPVQGTAASCVKPSIPVLDGPPAENACGQRLAMITQALPEWKRAALSITTASSSLGVIGKSFATTGYAMWERLSSQDPDVSQDAADFMLADAAMAPYSRMKMTDAFLDQAYSKMTNPAIAVGLIEQLERVRSHQAHQVQEMLKARQSLRSPGGINVRTLIQTTAPQQVNLGIKPEKAGKPAEEQSVGGGI